MRDGLAVLLGLESDIKIVAAAENGADAVAAVAKYKPDLVLMDLKMPVMDGIEATRQIVTKYPEIKVLVLTTYDADEWVYNAIRAGASGYLLKDTPREDLVKAIRGTMTGKTYIDPSIAGKVLKQASVEETPPITSLTDQLTEREIDVLRLIAKGFSNTDIAQKLFLSEGTVRNYVSLILTKLDVSDRTQAAIIAIKHGLK